MTALPRRLDEIDGLVRVGEIPAEAAAEWGCGTLALQTGPALFLVDDPQRYPAAVRDAIELRATALIIGECAHCHGLRPALAAPTGGVAVRWPRDPHEPDCPASEMQIAAALEGEDDRTERRENQ